MTENITSSPEDAIEPPFSHYSPDILTSKAQARFANFYTFIETQLYKVVLYIYIFIYITRINRNTNGT